MTTRALVLENFIPFRLSFTSNLVSDTIAQTYEALFGLTIPEWRLVAVVAEHDGITQQAIGRLTRMDKVVVSRAAAALVDRGLLARAAHPGDKRSHHLRLTDTGRELHAAIAAYLRGQRRTVEVRQPLPERPPTDLATPRCAVCGRPVDDDGGLFNLADMQTRRQCAEHYCPF